MTQMMIYEKQTSPKLEFVRFDDLGSSGLAKEIEGLLQESYGKILKDPRGLDGCFGVCAFEDERPVGIALLEDLQLYGYPVVGKVAYLSKLARFGDKSKSNGTHDVPGKKSYELNGVGTELFNNAVGFCNDEGYYLICLRTDKTNVKNGRYVGDFYRKNGARWIGKNEQTFENGADFYVKAVDGERRGHNGDYYKSYKSLVEIMCEIPESFKRKVA